MCSLYKEYFKNMVAAPYLLFVIILILKNVLIVGLNLDITSQGQGIELN